MDTAMSPTKPYFIRSLHEWIIDNNCTPYLLVDTADNRCVVPTQFVRDGMIVLNLAPAAVKGLQMGNDFILFSARFGGVAHEITVPVGSVRAIYAKENGRGLAFEEESVQSAPPAQTSETSDNAATVPKTKSPPRLTIVK